VACAILQPRAIAVKPNAARTTGTWQTLLDPTEMGDIKFGAGQPFPTIRWPTVGGGTLTVADGSGWRLLIVYRGKHCPLCRKYLAELNRLLDRFAERAITIAAESADSRDKAGKEAHDEGWRFEVAYDLSVQDMHRLGLYISEPESPAETDRPFAEPALFVVNPQGRAQVVALSNAPFARPDLGTVLEGLRTAQDKHSPIHGTAA
jgi:peroxiredoxin